MRNIDIVTKCEFCGKNVRGPSIAHHRRICRVKSYGPTTRMYPMLMPKSLHETFLNLCHEKNQTLREGVEDLIREEIKRSKNQGETKCTDEQEEAEKPEESTAELKT